MIEELKTDEQVTPFDSEWYKKEFLECFVDLDEKIEHPETLISIGEYSYKGKNYPIPVMTAGEYSCISAPSKSKKSFLKSQFVAAYIGGNSNKHFSEIKGHRDKDYGVADFDTEQSKFYAFRTFARVEKITGQRYKNYYPFKMRHLTPEERVAFIDNLLEDEKFRDHIKIMFVDGIADLINDSNDLVSSQEIVGKILKWTDIYNIHVCVVIHNRFGEKKPTGHLGSATLKKAESVIFLESEGNVVKVSQDYSRGKQFDEFYFTINDEDILPYESDEDGNIIGSPEYEQPKIKPITPDQAFGDDDNDVPF